MTLTEEQREAIRAVSDLPRAIGCTQCHSYIQEHYGNQFAILRAMIDSGEHFTDASKMPGFDLERARGLRDFLQDDCAEVGDVWAEMVAEIERLRAALVEHEEHENQTHEVLGNILGTDDTLENVAKRAAARIAELEKWLKKERSARLLEKSVSILLVYLKENDIDFDEFFEGKALEQLQAEGKIGPDADAKPRVWQITEEREAAVDFALEYISDDANDSNDPGICFCVASLRAMLTEAQS